MVMFDIQAAACCAILWCSLHADIQAHGSVSLGIFSVSQACHYPGDRPVLPDCVLGQGGSTAIAPQAALPATHYG